MAGIWKTVRVFISSTFRDMHAERDHLVKVVFPALRERLEKHRIHLIDIDLRWGVTREQAENDQALDLCLQQIDECRPFFLGILGERYGWVPTRYPAVALKRFGWIQQHTGKSVTELEILHGVLQDSKMHGRAFFYFRNPNCLEAIPDAIGREVYADTDLDCIRKLEDLKRQIRDSRLPVMENYPARWDPETFDRPSRSPGRLVGLGAFGERVRDQLWKAIQEEFQLPEQPPVEVPASAGSTLADEKDYHDRFMESRLRVYVGRKSVRNDLARYADGDDKFPCLVTGASGSGKSAALARFVRVYERARRSTLVISHFIGASPRSTNLRDMLRRFCQVFKARFGFAEDVPEEVAKLSVTFREFVGKVPEDARVLLVIDALNQLDETDRAQELYWLPAELPPQVKVIVSCITDSGQTEPVLEAFRWRKHCPVQLAALSDAEQRLIIRQVPSLSAKTLDEDQVRLLLSNPATANPLFLLVALEELRGFAPYERLNERIAAFPREGDTVTAIFTQVIERLAEEFKQKLVETVLTLLASARRGLSERELQELVTGLDGADDLFPVLRQLRPYLLSRAGLIDFYHRNLWKAVRKKSLPDAVARIAAHQYLAVYFAARWRTPDTHALSELPFHQTQGRMWTEIKDTLCNLQFIEAKCAAGFAYDLMEDYYEALAASPPDHLIWSSLEQFHHFYAANIHLLAEAPMLTCQQAANTPDESHPARAATKSLPQGPWLRWVNKISELSQEVRVLDGHREDITSLTFSPTDEHLLSAGGDGVVRLWDVRTGRPLWSFVLQNGSAKDVVYHPLGNMVAVAGTDAALHFLFAKTGLEHRVVHSDHYWVERCQFVDGGNSIVACELSHGDRTGHGGKQYVYLRDATTGNMKKLLFMRDAEEYSDFLHLSNTHVAAVGGRSFCCWNASTGKAVFHPTAPNCELAAISADERLVALAEYQPEGSSESTFTRQNITIFELSSGRIVRQLTLDEKVVGLALLPDGPRIFYATHTGRLGIRDIPSGDLLAQAELGEAIPRGLTCVTVGGWVTCQDGPLGSPHLVDSLTLRHCPLASIIGKPPRVVKFSAKGELVAVGAADGTISLVANKTLRSYDATHAQRQTRRRLAWDGATGRFCMIGSGIGGLNPILDLLSSEEAKSEPPDAWQILDGHLSQDGRRFLHVEGGRHQALDTLMGTSADCEDIEHGVQCLLPQTGRIALVRRGYPSQELALWDSTRGQLRAVLHDADPRFHYSALPHWPGLWNPAEVHGENFLKYALSPDGRHLVCGGMVTVLLLDLLTAEPRLMFRVDQPDMRGVEFSPDGRTFLVLRNTVLTLYSRFDGRQLWMREAKSYTPQVRPHRAIGRIVPAFLDEMPPYKRWQKATCSPDGRLLSAIAEAGLVEMLSCESGELLWEADLGVSPSGARFSPGGRLLLLLWDHRLEIRSAGNGEVIARLSDRCRMDDVAWLPKGEGIVITSLFSKEGQRVLLYTLENAGDGPRVLPVRLWEFTPLSVGQWSESPLVRCCVCGCHFAAPREVSGDSGASGRTGPSKDVPISCPDCGAAFSVVPFALDQVETSTALPGPPRRASWVRAGFACLMFAAITVVGLVGPIAWNWPWLLGVPLVFIGLVFWTIVGLFFFGVMAMLPCPLCGNPGVRIGMTTWYCSKCSSFEAPVS